MYPFISAFISFYHCFWSGDGYSIYIKGLPLNATPAQLEDEFKKFGPIKSGGIQVRSNRVCVTFTLLCGLCFCVLTVNPFWFLNYSNKEFVLVL